MNEQAYQPEVTDAKEANKPAIISMPLADGATLYMEIRPATDKKLMAHHLDTAATAVRLVADLFGKAVPF